MLKQNVQITPELNTDLSIYQYASVCLPWRWRIVGHFSGLDEEWWGQSGWEWSGPRLLTNRNVVRILQ